MQLRKNDQQEPERMMVSLGVLEELRLADLFSSDRGDLARPGNQELPVLTTGRPTKPSIATPSLAELIRATAERDRKRAALLVEGMPGSTSYAALAQAHAALNESAAAVDAARSALELSVVQGEDSDDRPRATDPSSARIAAEVLSRFGSAAEAHDRLVEVEGDRSLRLTKAVLASELGRPDDALAAIADIDGPMFEAFRGYLLASQKEYQKAIPHLRAALRETPDDADSALNLSISLWNIGGRRKATATALRATRMSPGRRDISMHFMELLLVQDQYERLASELRTLNEKGVGPDAGLLVLQVRLLLAQGKSAKAIPILERALDLARRGDDTAEEGEISSNLVVLRRDLGRITREKMADELERLLEQFPVNDAVVVNYVRAADRRSDAGKLRAALGRIDATTTPTRRAFLRHHVAFLEGDNEAAGTAALEWLDNERTNPHAVAAALLAVGIGLERWAEAETIADWARTNLRLDQALVNNVAYVLAMVGRADEAVSLLKDAVEHDDSFILRATLGLAHLASGDLDRGMRLYREAAAMAEKINPMWSALMATYQALVVRQLGLDSTSPEGVIEALSLAPHALPEDWEDRPDFLRVKFVCDRHGYPWPLNV